MIFEPDFPPAPVPDQPDPLELQEAHGPGQFAENPLGEGQAQQHEIEGLDLELEEGQGPPLRLGAMPARELAWGEVEWMLQHAAGPGAPVDEILRHVDQPGGALAWGQVQEILQQADAAAAPRMDEAVVPAQEAQGAHRSHLALMAHLAQMAPAPEGQGSHGALMAHLAEMAPAPVDAVDAVGHAAALRALYPHQFAIPVPDGFDASMPGHHQHGNHQPSFDWRGVPVLPRVFGMLPYRPCSEFGPT